MAEPGTPTPSPEIASEALVVVDLVESTSTSNLFGWYAVGRTIMRDLRELITRIGSAHGLQCMKSTGDGYLLAFRHSKSAETAVVRAVEAMVELLGLQEKRNHEVPEERSINLRVAVHFGEVDVIENDREGPHVSYTFRVEHISRASLLEAINPIPPEDLPLRNYVLCSEEAAGILGRRSEGWDTRCIGIFKLKGFPGWREVYQVTKKERTSDSVS